MINYFTKTFSYLKNPITYLPIIIFSILETIFALGYLFYGQPEVIFELIADYFITNPLVLISSSPFAAFSLVLFYLLSMMLVFWVSIIYSKIDSKKFLGEIFSLSNFKSGFTAAIAVSLIVTCLCFLGLLVIYLLSFIHFLVALLFLFIGLILMFYYMIRFLFFPFIMGKTNLNFYHSMMESHAFTRGKFWNIIILYILLQILTSIISYIFYYLSSYLLFIEDWIIFLASIFIFAFNQLVLYSYYKIRSAE